MVSRVPPRRWLFRDFRQTLMLLVWTSFAVAMLMYFVDWSSFIQRATAARPQLNGTQSSADKDGNKLYSGSILLPARGPLCMETVFDNRTGTMTEKGLVDCHQARSQSSENAPQTFEFKRLRAIGKAFNRAAE